MPSKTCPAFYTLRTTHGRQAVIYVSPDQDRWLVAFRYVRAYYLGEVYLAHLRPAIPQAIAAFQAEHPHARLDWLADDP